MTDMDKKKLERIKKHLLLFMVFLIPVQGIITLLGAIGIQKEILTPDDVSFLSFLATVATWFFTAPDPVEKPKLKP